MFAPDASSDSGVVKDGGPKSDASSSTKKDASIPGDDDTLTDDNACAATSVAAEQVVVTEEVQVEVVTEAPAPVALYVMFDRSSSMTSGGLWTPAVNALKGFVQDTDSAGMDIALQYFPSGGGSCNGSGYSTPAVAMGRLPAHASTVTSSLSSNSGSGLGTPIEGALRGVTEYCKTFQASHANEKCVAVLVTDGEPLGCEGNTTKLAAIAKAAWDSSGVRTFAVGLKGADFGLLDAIAKAGNAADCDASASRWACDVSAGAEQLSVALNKIRESVKTVETHTETQTKTQTRPLECEWVMPAPEAGKTLDKDRVNVTLGGTESLPLGRVPSADQCQPGAWHFDVAESPTRIIACPATCDAIKTGSYTDVKILLGCETKILVI